MLAIPIENQKIFNTIDLRTTKLDERKLEEYYESGGIFGVCIICNFGDTIFYLQ